MKISCCIATKVLVAVAIIIAGSVDRVSAIATQEGEVCATYENDADLLPSIFPDDTKPLVGGTPGCTIGDQSANCYCHFERDGAISSGESNRTWVWLCGADEVPFGPIEGKTCPEAFPEGQKCDATMNPTGYPGDPSCGYNDCDSDATYSATCGCIDLFAMGQGNNSIWICFKSGCDCPEDESSAGSDVPTSGAAVMLVTIALVSFLS